MTIIFICAIVILLILLAASWYRTGQALNLAEKWEGFYHALEQGRDEESEAYEQMFLSLNEQIYAQSSAIGSYVSDLHFLLFVIDKTLGMEEIDDETTERLLEIKNHTIQLEGASDG